MYSQKTVRKKSWDGLKGRQRGEMNKAEYGEIDKGEIRQGKKRKGKDEE